MENMAVDLSDFDAGVRGLPLPLLYAVGTGIALLALIFLRIISNSLSAKSPPIFEGTPFVGGIMKFIKVRPSLHALRCYLKGSFKAVPSTRLVAPPCVLSTVPEAKTDACRAP